FVLRVFEVVLLVFLAVLAAVYLSAITDVLERRFRMPRWAGLVCAVAGSLAVLVGAGALILPPVIDQTQALISALPQSFTDLQGVIARWAARYPLLRPTLLPALLVLGSGDGFKALAVVLLGVAIHLLEANVIAPLIMEKKVALPPVLTIAAVLVMGVLLGAVGLVVAVPVLAVALVVVRHVLQGAIYGDGPDPAPAVLRASGEFRIPKTQASS